MKMIDKAKAALNSDAISNYKISEITGISNQALSSYKKGKRDLKKARYYTVEKIANVYDEFIYNEQK